MESRTLLQKYKIPISHLDFDYIKNCKNVKELERIVAILRSGEEGYYPDLTICAEDKLRELKPHSKALHKEEHVITKSSLSVDQLKEYSAPIYEWTTDAKKKDSILSTIQENPENISEMELPPIRKGGKVSTKKEKLDNLTNCKKSATSDKSHIAATNYNKWDKYDADGEVLKMDLEEERVKEQVERMNRINQNKSAIVPVIEEKKSNPYEKLSPIEREKLAEDYKIRGNEYFKSKEFQSAVENYSTSIDIQPSVAGFNNRAVANLKQQKYAEALADCNECLQLDLSNIKALLRKAEACLGLGRKLDAFQIYEQINLIEPENAVANKAFEKLRIELGEVAPSHATRLQITEVDESSKNLSMVKVVKPSLPPKQSNKPTVDYDLSELIKPNKLVKNSLMKTMENISKFSPKSSEGMTKSGKSRANQQQFLEASPDIKLLVGDSRAKPRGGKCLIEEL